MNSEIAIGNQTAFAAADFLAPFQYALDNGFDAFEWFPDKKPNGAGWDETDLNAELRAKVRRQAQAAGMRLSVHARWTANPLQPDGIPILLRDAELVASLGATLLNLHLYTEAGIPAFAESLTPLLQRTNAAGLQVSLENTVETSPDDFNEFFALLRSAAPDLAKGVGMCLDIGHANLCTATRNDYLGFLDRLDPIVPLIHVHLHENWGDADSHLPLFTGPARFDPRGIEGLLRRLRAWNFSGSLILEQWPQPPSLLNEARDRLREMLRKPRSVPAVAVPLPVSGRA